jgi:hypothetical protein
VDEQDIGTPRSRGINEPLAGRHAGNETAHVIAALDLQTVRAIILEQPDLEQVIGIRNKLM